MKESKILKSISCLALIIFTSLIILSIFTITVKDNPYYNEEHFFKSELLAQKYMSYIEAATNELIFNNDSLYSVQDGEIEIHYSINQYDYQFDIKDRYFLVIYKNKALTNVELTNTTSTIENIKTYIENNNDAKQVNIINGDVQSESDIIQKFGIQYLGYLKQMYYTRTSGDVEYISTEAKDFTIYSSYVEEFKDDSQVRMINNILKKLEPFEKYNYLIIPISSILIVLILLYLVISIGYKKGVEGIALNDFDKIPLEFIVLIAAIIGFIPFIILEEIHYDYKSINFLIITAYFLIYTLCLIIFDTIIKRIKARIFWKSTLIGKVIILISKFLEWLYIKYTSFFNTITYTTSITLKTCIYFGVIIPLGIAITFAVQDSFTILILEVLLATIVAYKNIKTSKEYAKIENKLKEMYEGNNKNPLEAKKFRKRI